MKNAFIVLFWACMVFSILSAELGRANPHIEQNPVQEETKVRVEEKLFEFPWVASRIDVFTNQSVYIVQVNNARSLAREVERIAFYNGTTLLKSYSLDALFNILGSPFPYVASNPIKEVRGLMRQKENYLYVVEGIGEVILGFDPTTGKLELHESKYQSLRFSDWYQNFNEKTGQRRNKVCIVGRIVLMERDRKTCFMDAYNLTTDATLLSLTIDLKGMADESMPAVGEVWAFAYIDSGSFIIQPLRSEKIPFSF